MLVKNMTGEQTIGIAYNELKNLYNIDDLTIYAYRFSELKDIMFNRLTQESQGTRVFFKEMKIANQGYAITVEIK